jgi:hypothetical protein
VTQLNPNVCRRKQKVTNFEGGEGSDPAARIQEEEQATSERYGPMREGCTDAGFEGSDMMLGQEQG